MEGALALLAGIFRHPANDDPKGSPTDFLHDAEQQAEDRAKKLPSRGLDAILAGFAPQQPAARRAQSLIEQLLANRTPDEELKHRFTPFNALVFKVDDYERCSAHADSMHLPAEGEPKQVFGLKHGVVDSDDSTEDYDFAYELRNGDELELRFQGELLQGKDVYFHLKALVFARYLREVVAELRADSRFASFPKAVPFRFVLRQDGDAPAIDLPLARVDEASLAGDPHRQDWLDAARIVPPTPDEEFAHLVRALDSDQAPELTRLAALVVEHPWLLERLRADADTALLPLSGSIWTRKGFPPAPYCRFFWRLAEQRPDLARDYQERFLASPPPALSETLREALETAGHHVGQLEASCAAIPPAFRERLAPAIDAAWARLLGHPVWTLVALEHREPRLTEAARRARHAPRDAQAIAAPVVLPEGYLETVTALVDLLPAQFSGYGSPVEDVLGRLVALGTRARPAADAVLRLLDRWARGADSQLVSRLGAVLFAIGLEEPPPAVVATHQRDEYAMDFFPAWARRVPAQRLAALQERLAADPRALADPAGWEAFLSDSRIGLEVVAKAFAAESGTALRAALERTLDAGAPGPRLASLLGLLAEAAERAGRFAEVVRLLSALRTSNAKQKQTLRAARVAALIQSMESPSSKECAFQQLAALLEADPRHPVLRLLEAGRRLEGEGPDAALAYVSECVRVLAAEDLVYQEDFLALTHDEPERSWAVLREGQARFREHAFPKGRFTRLCALDEDPFREGLRGLRALAPEERERRFVGHRDELATARALRAGGEAALLPALATAGWPAAGELARQLLAAPTPERVQAVLAAHARLAADDDARRKLSALLWEATDHRPAVLRDEAFCARLPEFIRSYPERSEPLARQVFAGLEALGLQEAISRVAEGLPAPLVIATFGPVLGSFLSRRDFAGALALLGRLFAGLTPQKPEYMLVGSNLAVVQMVAGDLAAAERVFDGLFAQDYRRFAPRAANPVTVAVLGDDLDQQLASTFQRYLQMGKYNAACLYALTARPALAVQALREACVQGLYAREQLRAEPDFRSLQGDQDFEALLASLPRSGAGAEET